MYVWFFSGRSGDKALAEKLALPQTHFQLDYTRPEQLLLRVVVRGLVLWDEVSPTEEWVDAQVRESVSGGRALRAAPVRGPHEDIEEST